MAKFSLQIQPSIPTPEEACRQTLEGSRMENYESVVSLPIKLLSHAQNHNFHIQEDKVNDLRESVREKGILMPLIAREYSDAPGYYEIIADHHRYEAAKNEKVERVPCIIKNVNKIDTVINDITYMLETFYTIYDDHPSGDRYAKLKDYVTKEYEFYISNLTTVSTEYRQSIDIQDTFYSKLTDTEARVLVFCTVSMESKKWGSVTQPNVYEIEAQYNSELQKWQVAGIKVGEGISFQDFKTA